MGGRVALEIMRRAPQRVERLALLDTGWRALPVGQSRGDDERAARLRAAGASRATRACARWAGSGSSGWCIRRASRTTGLMDAILDMIERQTPDRFAAQIEALLARPDAGAVLRAIDCPTLVLCGRQDAWSPLAQHEEMAAMIAGCDARGDRRLRPHGRRWSSPSGWPTRCWIGCAPRWPTAQRNADGRAERSRAGGSRRSAGRALLRAGGRRWSGAAGVCRGFAHRRARRARPRAPILALRRFGRHRPLSDRRQARARLPRRLAGDARAGARRRPPHDQRCRATTSRSCPPPSIIC